MALLCRHQELVTRQVQPTIELLNGLGVLHPDILLQHSIQPNDYSNGLVFRSAVESIRGTFIASSTAGREGLVRDTLENLFQRGAIVDYASSGGRQRYDFTVVLQREPDYCAAIEVKGGEGNSINISERPLWAKEFGVWCHLDGAIVNQPAHGVHAIINRLVNELVKRRKRVDVLILKDVLCGTRTKPCPKYVGAEESIGLNAAPDIFLFPRRVPSREEPCPPVCTLEELRLPRLVLELFDVDILRPDPHIWEVHVELKEREDGRLQHTIQVWHQGEVVDESTSRPWQPEELRR